MPALKMDKGSEPRNASDKGQGNGFSPGPPGKDTALPTPFLKKKHSETHVRLLTYRTKR